MNVWTFLSILALAVIGLEVIRIIQIKPEPPFDELLKPRSIYAGMIYLTFCYLAAISKIEARFVVEIVMLLMAFYFGFKAGQKTGGVK